MKFNIGDWVVCVKPNIDGIGLVGRIGTVESVDYNDSEFGYRVDFKDGYLIWCKVVPATKLHKLLLGVDSDKEI